MINTKEFGQVRDYGTISHRISKEIQMKTFSWDKNNHIRNLFNKINNNQNSNSSKNLNTIKFSYTFACLT